MDVSKQIQFNSGRVYAEIKSGKRTILDNVSVSLDSGELMALVGESGSGKTMLALNLMNLLPINVFSEGRILNFFGEDLSGDISKVTKSKLGREIVYIPQSGAEYLNPLLTIETQMLDAFEGLKFPKSEKKAKILGLLETAGLKEPESILKKYPFQLSGGQCQRITIAISALGDPKLLIADEPTNGLDEENCRLFLKSLNTLFPNAAKIIITHDMAVAKLCENITVLRAGKIVEQAAAQEVINNPQNEYTKALINAVIDKDISYVD